MISFLSGNSPISPPSSLASLFKSYVAPSFAKLSFGGCWSTGGVDGCGVRAYHIVFRDSFRTTHDFLGAPLTGRHGSDDLYVLYDSMFLRLRLYNLDTYVL